jgi:hypothetical protein
MSVPVPHIPSGTAHPEWFFGEWWEVTRRAAAGYDHVLQQGNPPVNADANRPKNSNLWHQYGSEDHLASRRIS